MLRFLFSFNGRVNRAKFWIFYICACLFGGAAGLGTFSIKQVLTHAPSIEQIPAPWPFGPSIGPIDLVFTAFLVLFFYSVLAMIVKRFHDRNKSAWWLAFFYGVPLITFVAVALLGFEPEPQSMARAAIQTGLFLLNFVICWWYLIELLFLPGTRGNNRFGPDPRANKTAN